MPVFLNVDAGELPDEPSELFALADVVNVAGGGHAGDATTIAHAARRARTHGTGFGAHPSYDDCAGFGRRALAVAAAVVAEGVRRQCRLVLAGALSEGVHLGFVKPHGALYHASNRDRDLARAIVEAAREVLGEITVIGPPNGALRDEATRAGLPFAGEGFADRGYDDAGVLLPRDRPGALLRDPADAVAQALRLAATGAVDTLCVHGDSPGAVSLLAAVRTALRAAGAWSLPARAFS